MADKIAQVQGVLHYNDGTREEMLRRLYWKDAQYTRFGGNFVKYAELKDRSAGSLTDGDSLFVYTYDKSKPYGAEIWRDYLGNNLRSRNVYSNESGTPNGDRWKWEGDYFENFTDDTKLQRIGDVEVTKELAVATYAKQDRHMKEKYITPELDDFYGSSPGLNTKLFKYTFGQYYTGRISDIEEADVKIEHDYLKYLFSGSTADITEAESSEVFNNPNVEAPKRHMAEMLFQAQRLTGKSYLAEGERYVKPSGFNEDGRIVFDDIGDFQDFAGGFYGWYVGEGRKTNKNGMTSRFDEGDYENQTGTDVNAENGPFAFSEPTARRKTSLLSRTNELFKRHKIATLSGRFHTTEGEISSQMETTDTAKSSFGNSHGRNLLKKNPFEDNKTNGYENPYCRVWTYHHQYDRASRMIRPFSEEIPDKEFDSMVHTYTAKPNEITSSGFDNLRLNTVLRKDGFLNIAPKGDACGNITTEIKKCMFSIENLAWKDVPRNQGYISKEQRGPNGGRIMWFPPYDLDFNETVSVNWNQSNFIGRGEAVYTYGNTTRQGTLSFAILVDHPSIINNIPKYNLNDDGTSNDDFEADVLRFFAGCAVPNLVGKLDCDENQNNKPNNDGKKTGDEPALTNPSEEKGKHIKFYVFYPNNYSGNGSYLNNWQWETGGSSDVDWYDYIFFGKDTKIADMSTGYGYEMNRSGGGVTGPKLSPSKNDLINNGEYGENGYINVHAEHITGKPGTGLVEDVWYQYRVDFDLHEKLYNRLPGQKLYTRAMNPESNYFDSANYRLNTNLENVPKDATHTFAQIVALIKEAFPNAFEGKKVNGITPSNYTSSLSDREDLIKAFKEHKFQKVVMKAGATSQDSVNSVTLAQRRGRSLRDLLKNEGEVDVQFDPPEIVTTDKLKDATTINSLEAKLQRYASVELWYDIPETQKLSDTVHTIVNDEATGNGETLVPEADEWDDNDSPTAKLDRNLNPSVVVADAVAIATEGANMSSRYETEAEFFKELEKEHPHYFTNLIKKFKYFSPAYHSISPEGFNARLTFLQQCTRQGHTISATDLNYAKTAGNLAFGRMPVCVLRIGDFLNTKILINSMSINYGASGNPQWDLNPEGIGVQPMYAKVQLGITILGGQSLDGPINRLQNAVSFNYYANTGVYDDRADRINSKMIKKVFDGSGDEVRVETVETSGDKLKIYDTSEYGIQKTSYDHLWSPYPNLVVKDDYDNNIASYNEYMAAGGTKGVVKDENGKYRVKR